MEAVTLNLSRTDDVTSARPNLAFQGTPVLIPSTPKGLEKNDGTFVSLSICTDLPIPVRSVVARTATIHLQAPKGNSSPHSLSLSTSHRTSAVGPISTLSEPSLRKGCNSRTKKCCIALGVVVAAIITIALVLIPVSNLGSHTQVNGTAPINHK